MATAYFKGGDGGKTESMSSFHAGLSVEFRLSDVFFLNSGAIFSSKGYNYSSYNDIEEKGAAQYIDIPLLASVRFPAGKRAKFQVNVGPYIALCVGGKVSDEYRYNWGMSGEKLYDEPFSSVYNSLDYGLQAGLGLDLAFNYHLGVSYQLGMEKKYQNRNLMVSLGYRF